MTMQTHTKTLAKAERRLAKTLKKNTKAARRLAKLAEAIPQIKDDARKHENMMR